MFSYNNSVTTLFRAMVLLLPEYIFSENQNFMNFIKQTLTSIVCMMDDIQLNPSSGVLFLFLMNFMCIFINSMKMIKFFMMTNSLVMVFLSFADVLKLKYLNKFFFYTTSPDFFLLNNFDFVLGGDSVTLNLLFLNQLLFLFSFLMTFNNMKYNIKLYFTLMSTLQFVMILCLLSLNLFYFYFFFELSLMPMFLMMNMWGSSSSKIYASYQFLFYTMLGSMFLLAGIFYLYSMTNTLNMVVLNNIQFNSNDQMMMWMLLFIGFATKMPMIPFHTWLPEAHVEAPTSGSMVLAGMLLKLGTYGMYRFLLPLCYFANNYFLTLMYSWTLLSMMYVSFIILSQYDLKKIMAYSSVMHMNVMMIGLFSSNFQGLHGSVFLMMSHGMMSAGLFSLMGIVYDSYKTSNLLYYGGLVYNMPFFSFFFLFFTLCNLGFPLTSNFMGEILMMLSVVEDNIFLMVLLCAMMNFGTIYCMWLCNSILFGKLNSLLDQYSDLSESEIFILFFMFIMVLILGMYPNLMFFLQQSDVFYYLELMNN